jgi:hypothetical protein
MRNKIFFEQLIYACIACLIAAAIYIVYLPVGRMGSADSSSFQRILDGTAPRPYVFRVLIPSLAKIGTKFTPNWVAHSLQNVPKDTMPGRVIHGLSKGTHYREALHALFLGFLSLAGFILAEKKLLHILGYPVEQQYVLPFFLAVLVPMLSVHFAYVYDLPQMFLFAVSSILLYQRRWGLYFILLAIATLNKETSLLLILIYAAYYFRQLPLRKYIVLLASQLALFGGIQGTIRYIYRDNPGNTMYWTFPYHMDQYAAYPVTFSITAIIFGMFIYLIFKDWTNKPAFLRYASIAFFITLILFFVGGMPMEFRIFLDILPIFGIMLFPHRQTLQMPAEAS